LSPVLAGIYHIGGGSLVRNQYLPEETI